MKNCFKPCFIKLRNLFKKNEFIHGVKFIVDNRKRLVFPLKLVSPLVKGVQEKKNFKQYQLTASI